MLLNLCLAKKLQLYHGHKRWQTNLGCIAMLSNITFKRIILKSIIWLSLGYVKRQKYQISTEMNSWHSAYKDILAIIRSKSMETSTAYKIGSKENRKGKLCKWSKIPSKFLYDKLFEDRQQSSLKLIQPNLPSLLGWITISLVKHQF